MFTPLQIEIEQPGFLVEVAGCLQKCSWIGLPTENDRVIQQREGKGFICAERLVHKSLDASGGSVFLNLLGAAEGALIRAAASTLTFAGLHPWQHRRCQRIGHISKLILD